MCVIVAPRFCAHFNFDSRVQGYSTFNCVSTRTPVTWTFYAPCLTVLSSGFVKTGFEAFLNGPSPNLRLDSISIVAAYPNYRYQWSNIANFCGPQVVVAVPGIDQDGTDIIFLDRVKVTPLLWQ